MSWKASIFLGITVCILQGCSQKEKSEQTSQASSSLETSQKSTFPEVTGIQLIQFGEAKIEDTEYEGKPLTGVVAEIEFPVDSTSAILNASSIYANGSSKDPVPVLALFLINVDDTFELRALGGTQMRGWKVLIREDEFHCYGSPARMALLMQEGGLTASSKAGGKIKVGLVFLEELSNISSITILGKAIELKQG